MNVNRTKVLLIDCDETSYSITRSMLSRVEDSAIDLEWVSTLESGLAAIRSHAYDAYLIDFRLGDRDGLELLRISVSEGCRAPLIIITGEGQRSVDVQAMQEGAADYLSRSVE